MRPFLMKLQIVILALLISLGSWANTTEGTWEVSGAPRPEPTLDYVFEFSCDVVLKKDDGDSTLYASGNYLLTNKTDRKYLRASASARTRSDDNWVYSDSAGEEVHLESPPPWLDGQMLVLNITEKESREKDELDLVLFLKTDTSSPQSTDVTDNKAFLKGGAISHSATSPYFQVGENSGQITLTVQCLRTK